MSTAAELEKLLVTPELPDLGPGPRNWVLPLASLEPSLAGILQKSKAGEDSQALIRALVFLWHDHFDAAHELAQADETSDGAFLHGIVHRREPDYSNARYWFRRVDGYQVFERIARRVVSLAADLPGSEVRGRLIGNRQWDPFAFIEACGTARSPETRDFLREVQRVETQEFLNYLAG